MKHDSRSLLQLREVGRSKTVASRAACHWIDEIARLNRMENAILRALYGEADIESSNKQKSEDHEHLGKSGSAS